MGAGVAAAFAGCRPTGTSGVDELLTGAFAAAVTLAATRSQRWTWLVLGGAGVVLAESGPWQWVALAGAAVAFGATVAPRRRWIGALAAALAVQGLLRSSVDGFHGASAVLALAATCPVFISAYEVAPGRDRRRVRQIGVAVAVVVGAGAVLAVLAALTVQSQVEAAVERTAAGLDALAEGDAADASEQLRAAADGYDSAGDVLGAWWTYPARAVPVVAQHIEALEELAVSGQSVTEQAGASAALADVQTLRYENGQLDLARVAAMEEPLAATLTELEAADAVGAAVDSSWLLPPLADRVERFRGEVSDVLPEARLSLGAVQELPGLLGAEGTKRYLVLFTTPAESRGLGGFVGNWALLEADDGAVEMVESGRIGELNDRTPATDRVLTGPDDYLTRYRRFGPSTYLQNTTLSPDFPTVAAVWRELWPQLGGEPLDGVMAVDPYGLAALLDLTGPITVDGWPTPLGADNAAEVLLREQYLAFDDNAERVDLLDEASRVAFEELTTGTLPGPRALADALAPAVEQGRLRFWTFEHSPRRVLEEVGVDGTFARPDGGDFLALVTQNQTQNKIDVFLHREVEYQATFDPSTGETTATATVTLTNDAPDGGLPDAVIGSNDQGLSPGTHRVWLSLYSPLGLHEARLDGRRVPVEYGREFGSDRRPGWATYGGFFVIPAGGTITLEFDLAGSLDPGDYRLGIGHQPLVNPDRVHVEVTAAHGWAFGASNEVGVGDRGGLFRWDDLHFSTDERLEVHTVGG